MMLLKFYNSDGQLIQTWLTNDREAMEESLRARNEGSQNSSDRAKSSQEAVTPRPDFVRPEVPAASDSNTRGENPKWKELLEKAKTDLEELNKSENAENEENAFVQPEPSQDNPNMKRRRQTNKSKKSKKARKN